MLVQNQGENTESIGKLLLKEKGLKQTQLRIELIEHFTNSKHAQSYNDLKQAMIKNVDKSTLYRNLATFEEVGLIHSINDHSGVTKYAKGAVTNSGQNHAHFVCDSCETVYCMNGKFELKYEVPQGFAPKNVQTVIRGYCANCQNSG